jgi:hypothetical protein
MTCDQTVTGKAAPAKELERFMAYREGDNDDGVVLLDGTERTTTG